MKTKNSQELWQSRAKLQGSVTGHWLNLSRTSGCKTSNLGKEHVGLCNVGAGTQTVVWRLIRLNIKRTYASANVTRIISIGTSRGGKIHESHHRNHSSVVATLVLLVQQMAKRSQPFTDEASKKTGPSSKPKPVGKKSSRSGFSAT